MKDDETHKLVWTAPLCAFVLGVKKIPENGREIEIFSIDMDYRYAMPDRGGPPITCPKCVMYAAVAEANKIEVKFDFTGVYSPGVQRWDNVIALVKYVCAIQQALRDVPPT